MNHEQYREWLLLLLYHELDEHQQSLLNDHLAGCSECKEELDRLKIFHTTLQSFQPHAVSEQELIQSRRTLRQRLLDMIEHPSLMHKIIHGLRNIFPVPIRIAMGSLALVGTGIAIGLWALKPQTGDTAVFQPASMVQASYSAGDIQIVNVKFDERNDKTGDVEFTFDAVSPMHIRGNMNDVHVQKILARALLSEQNPGKRLQTVDMIGSHSEQQPNVMNAEVKSALIAALKYDPNPGVRKQAMDVLSNYLPDTAVTRAFLYVLTHEKNTGLVINAINMLDVSKFEHRPISQELQQFLQKKAQSEGNQYIKIKATAALQEMQQ